MVSESNSLTRIFGRPNDTMQGHTHGPMLDMLWAFWRTLPHQRTLELIFINGVKGLLSFLAEREQMKDSNRRWAEHVLPTEASVQSLQLAMAINPSLGLQAGCGVPTFSSPVVKDKSWRKT